MKHLGVDAALYDHVYVFVVLYPECHVHSYEIKRNGIAKMDYLDVDPILPPCQKYGLITCVYDDIDRTKFALKLRGCFETKEDATKFCERLNKSIPSNLQTPTYVVDLGSWLCMPPPTTEEITKHGGEEVFQEQFMQGLMQGYRENQAKKDEFFAERKCEAMIDGIDTHPSNSSN